MAHIVGDRWVVRHGRGRTAPPPFTPRWIPRRVRGRVLEAPCGADWLRWRGAGPTCGGLPCRRLQDAGRTRCVTARCRGKPVPALPWRPSWVARRLDARPYAARWAAESERRRRCGPRWLPRARLRLRQSPRLRACRRSDIPAGHGTRRRSRRDRYGADVRGRTKRMDDLGNGALTVHPGRRVPTDGACARPRLRAGACQGGQFESPRAGRGGRR